ncbi:MAG: ABC transporter ATP-binding protein [Caulobacteraceae bacterium]|nr:ABC transporter ATP-binding protein [Caulobacteraceae bacterium]
MALERDSQLRPGGGTAETPNPAYVQFHDVSKTYDGVRLAVADLNLAVARGEFLTFLGPSGSGKTTALMMLAGFEQPTKGDIILAGRSLSRTPPHRRNMGVVFQSYALFPHMTVAENVAFPLKVRGVRGAEAAERVRRALEIVRLTGFDDRRPGKISGGQQQRVALARALVFDPDVVLMDEPLGALDKRLRAELELEIKQIQRDLGITVIYVTHDQTEALTMSDRIAVFNDGMVQQVAPPQELYERPQTAFVANFIGENNRLSGVVTALDGETCAVRLEDETILKATPVGELKAGARATLSVRPERLTLKPAKLDNRLAAQVEQLIYQGDHTRIQMRTSAGEVLFATLPNAAGRVLLAPGEALEVGWRAADCRAFAEDGA